MHLTLTYFGSAWKGPFRPTSPPGLIGSGTAEVAALHGLDDTVAESTSELATADRERVAASLDRGLRCGRFGEADRDQALPGCRSPLIWASWPTARSSLRPSPRTCEASRRPASWARRERRRSPSITLAVFGEAH